MSNEQLVRLIKDGQNVTENMQTLYLANLPLIKKHIKPYTCYEPEEDLLQEAYFGLMEAVNHYDESMGYKFMTYAYWWIRRVTGWYIKRCSLKEVACLDDTIDDETGETRKNAIQDLFCLSETVIDKIYTEHSKNELWGIVERHTTDSENDVIVMRYMHNNTYKQIGEKHNVSIERARQLEQQALRKLRQGRAKRELSNKFIELDCKAFKSGIRAFKEHNETSVTEYVAMRRAELSRKA